MDTYIDMTLKETYLPHLSNALAIEVAQNTGTEKQKHNSDDQPDDIAAPLEITAASVGADKSADLNLLTVEGLTLWVLLGTARWGGDTGFNVLNSKRKVIVNNEIKKLY